MFFCRLSNKKIFQPLPQLEGYTELENLGDGIEFSFNPECRILSFGSCQNHFAILFGKIFNVDHLSKEIPSRGPVGLSQIQKLIILSQRHKENLPSLLHGNFILAMININTNEITLTKSPLNKYHLFFTCKNGSVYLSPSVPLIKRSAPISCEINRDRVIDMIARTNLISDCTFYNDINQVTAGEVVKITNFERISRDNYFETDIKIKRRDLDSYARGLNEILENSIKRQLDPSDKIICELSGGLDSSAIAARLAGLTEHLICISNFTTEESLQALGLNPILANERQLRDFSEAYKNTNIIRIDERFVECSYQEITKFCFDQSSGPEYGITNMLWIYSFFRFAEKNNYNKIFNGYFGDDAYSYKHKAPGIRGMIGSVIPEAIKRNRRRSVFEKALNSSPLQDFKDALLDRVYQGIELKSASLSRESRIHRTNSTASSCTAIDTAMLNSLNIEMVQPLADFELVNYCLSIPEKAFHHGSVDRYIARVSNKGILPDSIRLNRIKGKQSPRWHVQLKKELPYYFSLVEKFKSNELISELIDLEVLKSCMQFFQHHPENKIKDHIEFHWLPYTLHICEWISLHD